MRLMIAAAFLLAGCVPDSAEMSMPQHKWASYHDFVAGAWKLALANEAAPQPVKDAFANCVADRTDKFIAPEERKPLDDYALGNQGISIGDARRIDAAIRERSGIGEGWTNANVGLLADTCPNDVPAFRQYLKLPVS